MQSTRMAAVLPFRPTLLRQAAIGLPKSRSPNLQARTLCLLVVVVTTTCGCQGGITSLVKWPESRAATGDPAAPSKALASDDPRLEQPKKKELPAVEVNAESYAGVEMALGEAFEKDGRLESAAAAYEAALRNDPSLASVHHRLALVKEKLGRGEDALSHLQRAVQLEPRNAQFHSDLGYWHYLRRDWNLAERHLRRATQLDPHLARAQVNLALVLARTDRNDEALQYFARAGLSESQAYTNLGFVAMTDHHFPQAEAHLQRAIVANPDSPGAKSLLASLSQVTSQQVADSDFSITQKVTADTRANPATIHR